MSYTLKSCLHKLALACLLFAAFGHQRLWAQIDLSGPWANRVHEDQPSRGPGLEVGEWEGLPINDAARKKAESWMASVYTLPERQCIPFAADMGLTIGNVRIWSEADPASQQVVAWHIRHEWQAQEQVIWMDGRPRPPAWAPHTWQGFSTGTWEGNTLTVFTTHLKWAYLERNGVPRSDEATLTEHYMRHGDELTVVQLITDPVYTTEPMIRTRNLMLNPLQQFGGYTCRPAAEILNRPVGFVPHYLPGTNPFLDNASKRYQVPMLGIRGGAETMYPEFAAKLKTNANAPSAGDKRQNPKQAKNIVDDGQIHILPVQGQVYLLTGAGANVTLQVGDDSVLVVDAGEAPMSDKVMAAIRQISSKPLRTMISTNFDADHVGGNEKLAKSGSQVGGVNGGGFNSALAGVPVEDAAQIIGQENLLAQMSKVVQGKPVQPAGAWPTETYATPIYELFNGESIQVFHAPAAHTNGDSMVYFRRSDVISTGDIFSTMSYPVIDLQNGGSINGVIAGLNRILEVAIPKDKQEGGTYIIPGHGRVCDEADVLEYRDMVTIVRDRIADLIKKGSTLEQVKAANVTADYDNRYNTTFWTADSFVESAYRSLQAAPGATAAAR